MKPALRLILITAPLVAAGIAVLAFIISSRPLPERVPLAERAVPVRVVPARPAFLQPQITGYGLVRPARSFEAIPQVPGTAEYVNPDLQKGEILPEGAVLLRLSDADHRLAIARAEANIRAAEARLAEIDVSERNQRAALEIERKVMEIRETELERLRALAGRGAASQASLDKARAAWLAQRQRLQNLEGALALLPTQRRVQEEQISVHRASLATARLNLERSTLVLPFTARVAEVSVEVGQFVRTGRAVAVLDGVDAAEVEAQVSIADMLALMRAGAPAGRSLAFSPAAMTTHLRDLGLEAEVRLRLDDEVVTWPARLERVSDRIDQKAGTLGVILRVDTAYEAAAPGRRPPLAKGMFVEAVLRGTPRPGIIVPRSALRDGHVLLADEDDRLKRVPVRPAFVRDEVALVGDGIEEGARIVVSALSPAIEGMLLSPVRDEALSRWLRSLEAGR